MSERQPSRPLTKVQIVSVLVSTLALFFMVAFVAKSLESYRLERWRDSLRVDISQMERQREELEYEVRRRSSDSWIEEALRGAGQVSEGLVGVVAITCTPHPESPPTPEALPTVTPSPEVQCVLFQNENWEAWQDLIMGRP